MPTIPETFQHQEGFAGLSAACDLKRKRIAAYGTLDRLILVYCNT
jgi:hypothetical protein